MARAQVLPSAVVFLVGLTLAAPLPSAAAPTKGIDAAPDRGAGVITQTRKGLPIVRHLAPTNSRLAHAQLLEKATQGRIDLYFLGDSIVRRWGAVDYPELLANWRANFHGWNAANFGGEPTARKTSCGAPAATGDPSAARRAR
jgi:hypothetical protein